MYMINPHKKVNISDLGIIVKLTQMQPAYILFKDMSLL